VSEGAVPPLRLSAHRFFEGMPDDLLPPLEPLGRERAYAAGDLLLREGDPADRFVLIFSGKVALELALIDRPRVTVQTLGGGEVLGWSWLLPIPQTRFDARAVKATRTLELPAPELRAALDQHPAAGYEFLRRLLPVVAERLENTQLQLMDLHGH
jgi:CRP/FNR family transcriptional regulator, cyclic AMP receptor protein